MNPIATIRLIAQAYEKNDLDSWNTHCEALATWLRANWTNGSPRPAVPKALQCGAAEMTSNYKFWVTGGGILFTTPIGNFKLTETE